MAAILTISASVLAGAETVYTDQAAWTAATSGIQTVTFAGLGGDDNPDIDHFYGSGLAIDGVTFFGNDSPLPPYLVVRTWTPENFLYGPPQDTLCYSRCIYWPDGSGIDVTLPAGTTSVSWDFANTLQSGLPGVTYIDGLTVLLADGTVYTSNYTGSVYLDQGTGPEFVGFTSTSQIASFEIQGPGYPTIETFSFGTAISTPEPGYNAVLFCLFAITIPIARKRAAKSLP